MLLIRGYKDTRWQEWHVGDGPFPSTLGPGVEIKADGHELTWLMDAIQEGKNKATVQYYKETYGVTDEHT